MRELSGIERAAHEIMVRRAKVAGEALDRQYGVIRLTLPMPPTLANRSSRSRHWRALEKEKKQYWKQLDERQKYGLIPAPPHRALPRAELASTMYLGHAMDQDNAVARHKWAIDWLRSRGYIRKDSPESLRWFGFPKQVVRRGQEYRLEITLTEV